MFAVLDNVDIHLNLAFRQGVLKTIFFFCFLITDFQYGCSEKESTTDQ